MKQQKLISEAQPFLDSFNFLRNYTVGAAKYSDIKIAQEPVSLETPIGEEEDSHLGDFIPDEDVYTLKLKLRKIKIASNYEGQNVYRLA